MASSLVPAGVALWSRPTHTHPALMPHPPQVQVILRDPRLLPGEQHVFRAWHRDAEVCRRGALRRPAPPCRPASPSSGWLQALPRPLPTPHSVACRRASPLAIPPQAVWAVCMDARRVFTELLDPQRAYSTVGWGGHGGRLGAGARLASWRVAGSRGQAGIMAARCRRGTPRQQAWLATCRPTTCTLAPPALAAPRPAAQQLELGRPAAPQLAAAQHSAEGVMACMLASCGACKAAKRGGSGGSTRPPAFLLEPKLDGGWVWVDARRGAEVGRKQVGRGCTRAPGAWPGAVPPALRMRCGRAGSAEPGAAPFPSTGACAPLLHTHAGERQQIHVMGPGHKCQYWSRRCADLGALRRWHRSQRGGACSQGLPPQ